MLNYILYRNLHTIFLQIVHWKGDNLVNYSTFVTETQSIDYIMAKIIVQDTLITVLNFEEQDYISLTDMASAKEGGQQSGRCD